MSTFRSMLKWLVEQPFRAADDRLGCLMVGGVLGIAAAHSFWPMFFVVGGVALIAEARRAMEKRATLGSQSANPHRPGNDI